ncbi:T9SS type A sorting domain-containing protein [Ferruginibacter sp. SUN002]|uniref:T9SS type A sorting domain-containing protein n=1 Tax=Ferruginibacter sp. SUN002 TaxID=2937789 RepID=UPI003D36CE01
MNCKFLLSATFISATLFANAQEQATTAYAITGKSNNIYYWADIKQIDISSGKILKTLFEADKTKYNTAFLDKADFDNARINPTAYGTAACALDTRHNRLYFAPMHFSEIQYLDLSKEEVNFTVVKKNLIAKPANSAFQSEEAQLTRMVIAADGFGYALSNDANHLIRFSTDKKATVTDLGAITDEKNSAISIHEKIEAWGGDMVADAFGNLIVVSARHNVFSIDVNTKTAKHIGSITGLPENYTTNGVVVDTDGNLVVSSANVLDGLYNVNSKTYVATKVKSEEKSFNASDMANANLLSQKQYNEMHGIAPGGCIPAENATEVKKGSKVFPNPITSNKFNIQFNNLEAGTYNVVLTNISGKVLQTSVIDLAKGETSKAVTIGQKPIRGFYLVKIINASKKIVSSEKVLIN